MSGKILVLKGRSLYNVLRIAADYMAEAFQTFGYQVTVLDCTIEEESKRLNGLLKDGNFDLVFSFQALFFNLVLQDDRTAQFSTIKNSIFFGHIVDHPIYHSPRVENLHGQNMYIGCIDRSHVDYIRKFYPGVKHPEYLPHAGFPANEIKPYGERSIDVYFPCSYTSVREVLCDINDLPEVYKNISMLLIERLLTDPMLILQDEMENYLASVSFIYNASDFTMLMGIIGVVDQYQRAYERDLCIQRLIANGVKITVSGSGWDKFTTEYKDNITIIGEDGLDFLEVLEVMGDSKMVLNNAPTYQYGTHERIFTSMMCGAISLTNDFPIIREEFKDGENIVLFSRDGLNELANRIKYLLSNNKEAEAIAQNGKSYVDKTHTWAKNAEAILKIVGLE